jgi:hypothetical protein
MQTFNKNQKKHLTNYITLNNKQNDTKRKSKRISR